MKVVEGKSDFTLELINMYRCLTDVSRVVEAPRR